VYCDGAQPVTHERVTSQNEPSGGCAASQYRNTDYQKSPIEDNVYCDYQKSPIEDNVYCDGAQPLEGSFCDVTHSCVTG